MIRRSVFTKEHADIHTIMDWYIKLKHNFNPSIDTCVRLGFFHKGLVFILLDPNENIDFAGEYIIEYKDGDNICEVRYLTLRDLDRDENEYGGFLPAYNVKRQRFVDDIKLPLKFVVKDNGSSIELEL